MVQGSQLKVYAGVFDMNRMCGFVMSAQSAAMGEGRCRAKRWKIWQVGGLN